MCYEDLYAGEEHEGANLKSEGFNKAAGGGPEDSLQKADVDEGQGGAEPLGGVVYVEIALEVFAEVLDKICDEGRH